MSFDIQLIDILECSDFSDYIAECEGMITLDEASLLYDLAKTVKEGCIVEVGSYRGRSTVALALGSLDGHQVPVFAIDPHEDFVGVLGGVFGAQDRGEFFRAMIRSSCYLVVRLINLSSEEVAPLWKRQVGLLWIDGDHSYLGVKRDFYCWSPHLVEGAIIAFDDSTSPSLGPCRLINELLGTGAFTVLRTVGKITVLKCCRPRI